MDLKTKLNQSQLEAVISVDGPVLVIAGAGSGKTRVIEYRVLHLVQKGINPASILLLTFTRQASRTMLDRASRHDPRCCQVDGGTFHSFAYRLLKKYAKVIGFSDSFSIMDDADSEAAIGRAAAELGFYDQEKRFPKKDTLATVISKVINKNSSVAKVLEKEYPDFLIFAQEISAVAKKYAEYKIRMNLMDYDDLLVYAKMILENGAIREKLSDKYRYIMVDEYQDTNCLQANIANHLAQKHKNIMIVGDDAQSIYGFRGANHENIMRFPKQFSDCKIIKLQENYRSTQAILDLANAALENMENKYSKCLISARQEEGVKPQLQFFSDTYAEAEWIASRIKNLRDEGIELADQAVLFRSGYISIPLQAQLSKRNIPYQVFGGLKFYETAHVKDVLSHLRVFANYKDEMSWLRLLTLIEGIGPKTAEKVLKNISDYSSLQEVLEKALLDFVKKPKFSGQLQKLRSAFKKLSLETEDIGIQFKTIVEYYLPLMKNKFDDWDLRLNDLEALAQIAGRYEDLEELLADFAIESPETSVLRAETAPRQDERPLTLSTIHSAKGLEWSQVFILGMMDGVFPVSFALDDEEEMEEERRLFYVAITRAKDNLVLSLHHEASRNGISQFNKVSRFLDDKNVLSLLDKEVIIEPEFEEADIFTDEFRPGTYDKKFLYNKIAEYFDT